ncbi:MAG: C39 family peptidase [Chloroflexi bacterium]|nr:C39 family peptidase [Chloroflexota bacterium]
MCRLLAVLLALSLQLLPTTASASGSWTGERNRFRPAEALEIQAPAFRMLFPFRTQKDGGPWQISNCGPAALGMVLDGFSMSGQATDDLRYRSHTYQGTWGMRTGTALQHLLSAAEDFGVHGFSLYDRSGAFHNWSNDDLRAQLRLGRPVIVLVRLYLLPGYEGVGLRWGHYILLTGLNADGFYYNDSLQQTPETGAGRWVAADQLQRAMQASLAPGQAAAFGGPALPMPPLLTQPPN